MTNKTLRVMGMVASAALLAGVVGCESDSTPRPAHHDFFYAGETRSVQAFATAQAEAGARADATLQPAHFDGQQLNSLGRDKLDLMTAGLDDREMTIYMNFGEADGMDVRRESVVAYLNSRGFDESMFKFTSGANPEHTSPAAGHLSRLQKTESSSSGASGETVAPLGGIK